MGRKRERQHVSSASNEEPDDELLENLRQATAEISELVDAPRLLGAHHFQRLSQAVSALPATQHSSPHADTVLRSLRQARRAFQAKQEAHRPPLVSDYVGLLGSGLRQVLASERSAEQVVSWMREALQVTGSSETAASLRERRQAAEAEHERLERILAEYSDVHRAAAFLSSFGGSLSSVTSSKSSPSKPPKPAKQAKQAKQESKSEDKKVQTKAETLSSEVPAPSASSKSALPDRTLVSRADRLCRLRNRLLSSAVQLPVPSQASEETSRLSSAEVAKVFERHVPGVEKFLYRQQHGVFSLKFMQGAYEEGLRAFHGTDLNNHLLWLFRLVVHHGADDKPGASKYLREVAEAFTDCQAVQARTIEKVGLQLRGLALDFRGQLVRLVGEYKAMAIKMLAVEECTKLGGPDDFNDPAHFENRLIADLGEMAGLNKADIRQAEVDSHAHSRFRPFKGTKLEKAAARLHELFDLEALLKAFASEVSTFGAQSQQDSLPRLFLEWAGERMKEKHIVFDEETCTQVEVGDELALAVVEVVFLGMPSCSNEDTYRGSRILDLFHHDEELVKEVVASEASAKVNEKASAPAAAKKVKIFLEVDLDNHYGLIDPTVMQEVWAAEARGEKLISYQSRGFPYQINLELMVQTNLQTGRSRDLRRVEVPDRTDWDNSEDEEDD
jgi:hypothetical protein